MDKKVFPAGMSPIGEGTFRFACHPGVACFMLCCRRVDLLLYPYDIIRLKSRLGIFSDAFLDKHTVMAYRDNPFFPTVTLKMADNAERTCPFLGETGCTIYEDRPTACRMYPLERAVDRSLPESGPKDYYFVHRVEHCLGHNENREWTVAEWIRDQEIATYNLMNDLWVEFDTLIRNAPWTLEKNAEQKRKMAFMACYNLDAFRSFVFESTFLKRFKVPSKVIKKLRADDVELMKFGLNWLKFFLGHENTFVSAR
ncbi:MAG: YkgJ family cysteine cluster protein [Thermodesulfobacteriota bacterium]